MTFIVITDDKKRTLSVIERRFSTEYLKKYIDIVIVDVEIEIDYYHIMDTISAVVNSALDAVRTVNENVQFIVDVNRHITTSVALALQYQSDLDEDDEELDDRIKHRKENCLLTSSSVVLQDKLVNIRDFIAAEDI